MGGSQPTTQTHVAVPNPGFATQHAHTAHGKAAAHAVQFKERAASEFDTACATGQRVAPGDMLSTGGPRARKPGRMQLGTGRNVESGVAAELKRTQPSKAARLHGQLAARQITAHEQRTRQTRMPSEDPAFKQPHLSAVAQHEATGKPCPAAHLECRALPLALSVDATFHDTVCCQMQSRLVPKDCRATPHLQKAPIRQVRRCPGHFKHAAQIGHHGQGTQFGDGADILQEQPTFHPLHLPYLVSGTSI
ncbi:MAG: hypothetical protein J0L58_06785 [Burkholderiales bacterium]|nr:hypothetical protein [Burkholderiales bacterium]